MLWCFYFLVVVPSYMKYTKRGYICHVCKQRVVDSAHLTPKMWLDKTAVMSKGTTVNKSHKHLAWIKEDSIFEACRIMMMHFHNISDQAIEGYRLHFDDQCSAVLFSFLMENKKYNQASNKHDDTKNILSNFFSLKLQQDQIPPLCNPEQVL